MFKIFKLLGKGLLYFILIPVGIVFFAIHSVYFLAAWIVMLIRAIIMKIMHENPGLYDDDEIEALDILEESNKPVETQVQQQPSQTITYNINVNGPLPNGMLNNPNNYQQISNPNNIQSIDNQEPKTIDYIENDDEEDSEGDL